MKIAISGSEGQLGLSWQHYLKGDLDDTEAKSSTILPGYYESKVYNSSDSEAIYWLPLNRAQFDLCVPESIQTTLDRFQPDVLINTAAYTKVDQAEDEQELAFECNAKGVAALGKACMERDIRLVHYSTDYVFPGLEEDALKYPSGYPESAPTDPVNIYGETKWKGEQELLSLESNVLILRVSWLCSAYGNNFLKTILKRAKSHGQLKVVNDQIGVPTFTEDVIEQTLQLLQLNAQGVLHLGSKGIISWHDFAKEILEFADINVPIEAVSSDFFPSKAVRPKFSKLSTSKLENLGIKVWPWQRACKRVVSSLKDI
ncbi:MAG: dTDP-4-dehydrorhamnose reductase [Bacteroidetes bacterium]|nr:dTDP-4-dehydrorhamnose reductase [Bacteroidota bacterium]